MANIKFIFFTTNPNNSVVVETGITLNGNIASVPISPVLFNTLEDGVLNYVVEGDLDDDTFVFQRQSNYFLKTPTSFTNPVQSKEVVYVENGDYTITPDEGYSYMDKVFVNVDVECDINPDTLREITITENGRYTSAYSEPIKTGEFEDGTPFYGYAELNNMSYDTGIIADNDTKIELWWCGEFIQYSDFGIIGYMDLEAWKEFYVSAQNDDFTPNALNGAINFERKTKQNLESNVWYHIELSKKEGFKINGELIGTFEDDGDVHNSNIYFNTFGGGSFANGKYGMLKINDTIFIPTENGFVNYANQEPMTVFTEGSYEYGTYEVVYEGEPYKTINVNIPPAKLQAKLEYRSDTEGFFTILPDEDYYGLSVVEVNISNPLQTKYDEGLEQGKTEGKEDVVSSLQTLNVTENGTYTPPPTPFLRLDGDDKYEAFYPGDVNAFEIKFRVNSDSYTEFFSQSDNEFYFIGLIAVPNYSQLSVYWYNKRITIHDVDFSKWHTLVVKMGDENARVILDGQVYNDYTEWYVYESNGNSVNIYGNIDLEHFTFWETWEQYNNGVTPFYDFKVSSDGLMRNFAGGEYEVVDNVGGGSAQYMEETMSEGWNEVNVDVESDIDKALGPLLPLLENGYRYAKDVFDSWDSSMELYQNENPDNTSSTGMMYQMNIDAITGENTPIVDRLGLNSLVIGTSGVWIKNNLIRPWVYQERTDQTNIIILPEYWYGGFDCRDVEYLDAIFEGAESMKMFTSLRYLGQSFTGAQTLDLSSTDFLIQKSVYSSIDCYKEIADSVYDFTTPNANGVSYSNVKLPAKVGDETRNLWLSKGWIIVE